MSIRLDGPDLSHYQSDVAPIDWDVMRGAGIWWVATKATQSTSAVDPSLKLHRPAMRTHGFTHLLYYHWLSHTTSVAQQADHFLKTVGRLELGEGVMLDAEEGGITEAMCVEWCDRVEQTTQRPSAIYTGAFVAGGTIWQSARLFANRPRHLAAYTSEAKAKALPGVKEHPWDAWQYSSNGPVPGVTGRCDMNRIDNIAAFDRVCGIGHPPPVEKPPTTAPLPVQETEPMKVVSNAQDRVAPVDGQIYGAGKFVYIAQPDGTLRYVTGFEGRLYDGEQRVQFTNAELDEWLARRAVEGELIEIAEAKPPKYIVPSYQITVPPLVMTPEA